MIQQSSAIYLEDGRFEDRKDGHKVRLFVEGSYENEDKDTEPCLMFLNTEMAWPWVIPCRTWPLIERISSPETRQYLVTKQKYLYRL